MQGYGGNPPDADWPGGAKVAVSLVLNYEEGGENCLLHGDAASEGFLSEIPGAQPWPGQRHWNMESVYEYGARAGFWRLRDLFVSRGVPVTIYGVASALARATSAAATLAPSSASTRAVSRPIPPPAPVINATFSARCRSIPVVRERLCPLDRLFRHRSPISL